MIHQTAKHWGTLLCFTAATLVLAAGRLEAQRPSPPGETPSRLPEGDAGIAAKYPGDVDIEQDEAVVFVERFDGTLDEIASRWDEVKRQDLFTLSDDVPSGAASRQSLLITHTGGDGTGGHLYRRLLPGYKRIFWRFYVKLAADAGPLHHTPRIGGFNPPSRWPMGPAGQRPNGERNFRVGIGPHYGPEESWDFYAYWNEMRGSPPKGQTWGNSFLRNPDLSTPRDRWTCVEVMVKVNQPGERDGELALWLDGKLAGHFGRGFPQGTWLWDKFTRGHSGPGVRWNDDSGGREQIPGDRPFEGFRWRTSEDLKINFVWMLLYITRAPEGHQSRVWFDHIVVAEDYIGPITPQRP
jgi:hypothetical protein